MNIEDVKKLTLEEKRLRVGELSGWKKDRTEIQEDIWIHNGDRTRRRRLPFFPLDLNAVAEVEKTLTDDQFDRYAAHLERLCVGMNDRSDSLYFVACKTVAASAEHRCEALILTLSEK